MKLNNEFSHYPEEVKQIHKDKLLQRMYEIYDQLKK